MPSSKFKIEKRVNGGYIVRGKDATGKKGKVVLFSAIYESVVAYRKAQAAEEDFDNEVRGFFAPLLEAAEELKARTRQVEDDPTIVTLDEGVEAVEGVEPLRVQLDDDGFVMMVLDEGDHDTLRWVKGQLEVVA